MQQVFDEAGFAARRARDNVGQDEVHGVDTRRSEGIQPGHLHRSSAASERSEPPVACVPPRDRRGMSMPSSRMRRTRAGSSSAATSSQRFPLGAQGDGRRLQPRIGIVQNVVRQSAPRKLAQGSHEERLHRSVAKRRREPPDPRRLAFGGARAARRVPPAARATPPSGDALASSFARRLTRAGNVNSARTSSASRRPADAPSTRFATGRRRARLPRARGAAKQPAPSPRDSDRPARPLGQAVSAPSRRRNEAARAAPAAARREPAVGVDPAATSSADSAAPGLPLSSSISPRSSAVSGSSTALSILPAAIMASRASCRRPRCSRQRTRPRRARRRDLGYRLQRGKFGGRRVESLLRLDSHGQVQARACVPRRGSQRQARLGLGLACLSHRKQRRGVVDVERSGWAGRARSKPRQRLIGALFADAESQREHVRDPGVGSLRIRAAIEASAATASPSLWTARARANARRVDSSMCRLPGGSPARHRATRHVRHCSPASTARVASRYPRPNCAVGLEVAALSPFVPGVEGTPDVPPAVCSAASA